MPFSSFFSFYHFQVSVYHALNYNRKWPEMWIFTNTLHRPTRRESVILLSGNSSSCSSSSSTQNADKYSWMNEWMNEVSKLNREWGGKGILNKLCVHLCGERKCEVRDNNNLVTWFNYCYHPHQHTTPFCLLSCCSSLLMQF